MRWRLGALILLGGLEAAQAATWTCPDRAELRPGTLVIASCSASGTYTTGGDPIGTGGGGMDLCNSAQRFPVRSMAAVAASPSQAQAWIAIIPQRPAKVVLVTPGSSPGPGTPLLEVSNGTSIEGAIMLVLSQCG